MAHSFFLRLLLLVALIATTSLRLISASETPHPSSPPSETPPLKPTSPPITATPPPPPRPPPPLSPPPPPTLPMIQFNNIIDALIGAGDFAGWANILSSADPSSLPLTATLFIPTNDAISHLPTATAAGINFDPFLIPYHIVPQRLTFSDLQQFSTRTRLPTLLPSKYIVVTNNSPSNFTIDDSQVTHPDIFVNTGFSVHGIEKVLDYSVYGGDGPLSPPPENTTSPTAESTTAAPNGRNPSYPGEMAVDLSSSVTYLSSGFSAIFSVACAVLVFKILAARV